MQSGIYLPPYWELLLKENYLLPGGAISFASDIASTFQVVSVTH